LNCGLEIVRINDTVRVRRQISDRKPLLFLQILEWMKHGVVLDGRSDEMSAPILQQANRTKNGQVIGFSATRGENNLTRFAFPHARHLISKIIKNGPSGTTNLMNTRRITPIFLKEMCYHVPNTRIQGSSGIVVEIDRHREIGYLVKGFPARCQAFMEPEKS